MKKLAVITALSLLMAGPALANRSYMKSHHYLSSSQDRYEVISPGSDYKLQKRDLPPGDMIETSRIVYPGRAQLHEDGTVDFTGRYPLKDGRTLDIKDDTAYLVSPNGWRYYAPNGSYVTSDGATFFTDSGQVLRMESPPETVTVDTGKWTHR